MKSASICRNLWAGVIIICAGSAVAAPKEQLYGKGPNTAFEAGWPLRVNPPNRLAALNGEALQALFSRKPVWIEPAAEGAELPKAVVKFGFLHDPADLLQKLPIMAMVLGKDGKLVFERYQFGTTAQSLFDSQSIAKTLTALSIGALPCWVEGEQVVPLADPSVGLSQVACAMAAFAFERFPIPELLAVRQPDNLESGRFMDRLGMRQRGLEPWYGTTVATHVIARAEWLHAPSSAAET